MKKRLLQFICAAMTLGMMGSLNTMAIEPETDTAAIETENVGSNSVGVSQTNNIYLESENAKQDGVKALQISLKVEPEEEGVDVGFKFNDEDIKVSEYRYHPEENTLNIYVADYKPIFKDDDELHIGEVTATDEEGNEVEIKVSVDDNSLQFVSKEGIKAVENLTSERITDPEILLKPEHKNLEVKTEFPSSYIITIPSETYDITTDKNFNISASDVFLKYNETLNISVKSQNDWYLIDKNAQNSAGVKYHMLYNGKEVTDTILSVNNGATNVNAEVTIGLVDELEMAGTFTDRLTFRVNIIEKNYAHD
ncbi:MAG: hypothetical protein K2K89_10750 [Ruminococcus sp.]|nr:hypothetical protein [Ruminococcus sp.]